MDNELNQYNEYKNDNYDNENNKVSISEYNVNEEANKFLTNAVVYSVEKEQGFVLTARGTEDLCAYDVVKIEHPKLFTVETNQWMNIPDQAARENLD